MRELLAVVLFACATASHAAGMTAVPETARHCYGQPGYCFEWFLASDPSIRFIAQGDEDGIEYAFHRKRKNSQYKYLLRIQPVLEDSTKRQSYYWGYPWDIKDIVVGIKGNLHATFNHDLMDDGEVYSQPWQKRIPAVLFTGHTTQPNMKVSDLSFLETTLPSLIREGARIGFKPKP